MLYIIEKIRGALQKKEVQVVFCVALAAFNYQIDANMVNISIVAIADDFVCSTSEVSFVILTYMIGAIVSLWPAGWIATRFGIGRVFLWSCIFFMISTLLCAIAPNLLFLLVFRLLQGIGSGFMSALAFALIPVHLPKDRIAWGYAWLSSAAGIGMMLGAPLGGFFSEFIGWRGVFFLNAASLILLVVWAWWCIPIEVVSIPHKQRQYNVWGIILFSAGLFSGIMGLSMGQELGWTSVTTGGLFAFFAVSVFLAFRHRAGLEPLIAPEITSNRVFVWSLLVATIVVVCAKGTTFILPFYLNMACGFSFTMVSTILIIDSILYVVGARFSNTLNQLLGSRRIVLYCLTTVSITFIVSFLFIQQLGVLMVVLLLGIFGFARGIFIPSNNAMTINSLPVHLKGEAAVLIPLTNNMGALIGVSLFETVFAFGYPEGKANFVQQSIDLQLIDQGIVDVLRVAAVLFIIATLVALYLKNFIVEKTRE